MAAAAPPDSSPPATAEELLAIAEFRLSSGSRRSALKYARRAAAASSSGASAAAARRLATALKILLAGDHHSALLLPPLSSLPTIKRQYLSLTTLLTPHDQESLPSPAAAAVVGEALARVASAFAALSSAVVAGAGATFWTACGKCRLLHEFDRKYVGYRLVCPGCSKSFLAIEVQPPQPKKDKRSELDESDGDDVEKKTLAEMQKEVACPKADVGGKRKEMGSAARCGNNEKKQRIEENGIGTSKKKDLERNEGHLTWSKDKEKRRSTVENGNGNGNASEAKEIVLALYGGEEDQSLKREGEESGMMAVVDSDFYDFDKDRTEGSIKKGQVWAVYGDGDGMPRDYALIRDVISVRPFRSKVTWLDLQVSSRSADNGSADTTGMQISCGVYKVGNTAAVDMVNVFSHLVDCERSTKTLYRIFPKKRSVWALYDTNNASGGNGWSYEIIICLNSYSDYYGLSFGYLEKVQGYRSIFKRRSIGSNAVHWMGKDDMGRFSHQIPARKLSPREGTDLPAESWELDPASLPQELLTIG